MIRKFVSLILITVLILPTLTWIAGPSYAVGEVSSYSFDQTSGSTLNDEAGSNNGTLVNGPLWTASGKYDGALQFDGVNDYVNLGNPQSLNFTGSFTFSAWLYPQNLSNDKDIITKVGNGDGYFFQTTGSELLVGFYNSGWHYVTTSGLGLQTNTWTHVVGMFDDEANLFKIYVNGSLVASKPITISPSTVGSEVHIGYGWTGQNWNGRMDNVRIYGIALSATDVINDMNTPIGGSTPPPTDTTPPTASLTAPANGSNVSGTVTISANATDDVAVAGVTFNVDGQVINSEDTTSPYSTQWDSSTVTNGQHTLTATARDTAGNTTTSTQITVNTSNASLSDFVNELVVGNLSFVTTMEFLPDGKLLLGEVTGVIKVVPAGGSTPNSTPFLDIPNSEAFGDAGLLSIALDPAFSTNNFFYVFYAHSSGKDRLSRFTASSGWNTAPASSEVVLWEDGNSTNPLHHGSGIIFGNDGKIYFSTGDGGNPPDSQSLSSTHGKIMRINPDGTIPTDNPFYDGQGPNKDEIWARGVRNPFRLSYDQQTNRLFIADVGGNDGGTAQEEVNIGAPGANYGWPLCEGACSQQGITSPIYSYSHNGRDASITGGFVYRGTQFPSEFVGSYFFGDYAQNWIKRLTFDQGGNFSQVLPFEPEDGSNDDPSVGDIVEIEQGPDGALYYLDLNFTQEQNFDSGGLRRIRYIGAGNQPPIAQAAANPATGSVPLEVTFSSAGSLDPEGTALTYLWEFGDSASTTSANPTHTYTQAGEFQAKLTVSDGIDEGFDTVDIVVGNPPTATIISPLDNSTFRGGETISVLGLGSDDEDGNLPNSAYSWSVRFLHEGHVHPVSTTNATNTFDFTIPTTGHDFEGLTRYEITLTVTDSTGLTDTESVFIFPEKVDVTVDTVPSGMTVKLDGINKVTPFTANTLIGFEHTLEASNQNFNGTSYEFESWSNGGAQTQTFTVPEEDISLVANFVESQAPSIPNLFAHWQFEEGTGVVASDSSGNGLNGLLTNGPVWTTSGKYGKAITFDGSNDYVDLGNFDVSGNQMTMTAWVKFNSLPTSVDQRFLSKANNSSEQGHYWMFGQAYTGSSHRLRFRLKTGNNTSTLVATSGNLSTNTWYHASAVYNGSTMKLYLNGTEVGSLGKSGNIAVSSSVGVNIGRNPGGSGNNFAGTMDDVRIYNRALTPQEITSVMNGN